jgi:glycolate oxidase iron-sulfur subunit
MHVELSPQYANTSAGKKARELTSACVHCGFCLATCPTYLDSRDERDSPRGRIYLIKQLLETGQATQLTHTHLDRCLSCRSCETSCPSGMQYGQLLDIGRGLMEQQAPRPTALRFMRQVLRFVLSRPRLFAAALAAGQAVRPLLPAALRAKIPPRQPRRAIPVVQQRRTMLVLAGCVQNAATPNTNDAGRRILDRLGISLVSAPQAGCCGAVNYHLAAHDDGLDDMRRNIDAWWPHIENGAEAILSSASGCGSMLAEYGELLAHDTRYAAKARRVTQLARDIGEILLQENLETLAINTGVGKVAVHTPCTLQHALGLPDMVSDILQRAGFELAATHDKHLCCGSAGTYSILQTDISQRLRDKKLQALTGDEPTLIATANIGCQLHMGETASVPVVHWLELLDQK